MSCGIIDKNRLIIDNSCGLIVSILSLHYYACFQLLSFIILIPERADSIEGLNQSHDLALKPSAEASY